MDLGVDVTIDGVPVVILSRLSCLLRKGLCCVFFFSSLNLWAADSPEANRLPQSCTVDMSYDGAKFFTYCLGILIGDSTSPSSSNLLTSAHCTQTDIMKAEEEELRRVNVKRREQRLPEFKPEPIRRARVTCTKDGKTYQSDVLSENLHPSYFSLDGAGEEAFLKWMTILPLNPETYPIDLALLRLGSAVPIIPMDTVAKNKVVDSEGCITVRRHGRSANAIDRQFSIQTLRLANDAPVFSFNAVALEPLHHGDSGGALVCFQDGKSAVVGINSSGDNIIQALTPSIVNWLSELIVKQ